VVLQATAELVVLELLDKVTRVEITIAEAVVTMVQLVVVAQAVQAQTVRATM
jgi:hypothetical protein